MVLLMSLRHFGVEGDRACRAGRWQSVRAVAGFAVAATSGSVGNDHLQPVLVMPGPLGGGQHATQKTHAGDPQEGEAKWAPALVGGISS